MEIRSLVGLPICGVQVNIDAQRQRNARAYFDRRTSVIGKRNVSSIQRKIRGRLLIPNMAFFKFISNMLSGHEAIARDPYLPSSEADTQYWLDAQLNGYPEEDDSPPNTGNSLYSNIEPINRWRHGNRILKSPRRLDETPTKSHYDVSSFKRAGKTLAKGRRRCSRCGHALGGHGVPVVGKDEIEKVLEAKAGKTAKVGGPKKGARVLKKQGKESRGVSGNWRCKIERSVKPIGSSRVLRRRTVNFAL